MQLLSGVSAVVLLVVAAVHAAPVEENKQDGIGDLFGFPLGFVGDIIGDVLSPGSNEGSNEYRPPVTETIWHDTSYTQTVYAPAQTYFAPIPAAVAGQTTVVYGNGFPPSAAQPTVIVQNPAPIIVAPAPPPTGPTYIDVDRREPDEPAYIFHLSRCSRSDPGACLSGKCCKDPERAFPICMERADLRPQFTCYIPQ